MDYDFVNSHCSRFDDFLSGILGLKVWAVVSRDMSAAYVYIPPSGFIPPGGGGRYGLCSLQGEVLVRVGVLLNANLFVRGRADVTFRKEGTLFGKEGVADLSGLVLEVDS